jgi:hypothetical protein
MSRPNKILVAGIGNIFLGDDAFGSEVARRLRGANPEIVTRTSGGNLSSTHLEYPYRIHAVSVRHICIELVELIQIGSIRQTVPGAPPRRRDID